MFLTTFFGAFAMAGSNNSTKFAFAVYIIAFILGIILIRKGYKRFRYGGEIEEGTGIVAQSTVKKTVAGIGSDDVKSEAMEFTKNAAMSVAIGAIAGAIFNRN
jgi:hypothetical protein